MVGTHCSHNIYVAFLPAEAPAQAGVCVPEEEQEDHGHCGEAQHCPGEVGGLQAEDAAPSKQKGRYNNIILQT